MIGMSRAACLLVLMVVLLASTGCEPQSTVISPPGREQAGFLACLRGNGFLDRGVSTLNAATISDRFVRGFQTPEQDPVRPGYVHLYLDCYVTYIDPHDFDGRLLRGHMVLVLLVQYGAQAVSSRQVTTQFADEIMKNVRRAQRHLLAASPSGLEATFNVPFDQAEREAILRSTTQNLPNFHNAQRLTAILDVAAGIAPPDTTGVAELGPSIFATVAARDHARLRAMIERVVATFQQAQRMDWYGGAFLRDAQLGLQLRDPALGGDARRATEVWRQWTVRLNGACEILRRQALDKSETCTPGREEVRALIEREFGAEHPGARRLR